MKYLLRRLALYLFAAWAALTLNFFIPRMMPGDPAATMVARFRGKLQPEAMAALRETFGLTDEPLVVQYVTYLGHLVRADFGISVTFFPAPVSEVVGTGLLWTIVLVGTSLAISFTLGTLLGLYAGWRRDRRVDSIATPTLALLGAFPFFWLAMMLLYALGYQLQWFPLRHAYGYGVHPGWNAAFIGSVARHAVLPAATIVVATVGGWMLTMRNNVTTVLGEDYITFAQAKGLSRWRILFAYGARNAVIPSVTSFGMALGMVLSGSLLTEIVFAYPGQGYLLVQSVRNQDYPLMQGVFLTITLAVLVANALVDVLYAWIDPRTRSREQT
jgi:peptide/nickel transport system permease protein